MDSEFNKARAKRLEYLLQSPGWPDLLALLAELDAEATEALHSFAGWDRERKCDLMARMQAVHGMRLEIVKRVQENILAGQVDDVVDNRPESSDAQLSDEQLAEIVETRIPGTY
jgi:hypothetical protein